MRYMMFIKHTQDYRGLKVPAGLQQAMGEFIGEKSKKGQFIDGAGLKSTHRGKKVRMRGGKIDVVDGPFTESKEIIGGYCLMEAANDEEALEIGRQFMELHRVHMPSFNGECEIRPIETGEPGSD
jgi:hypothetical protein